jgi:hypothetical protein
MVEGEAVVPTRTRKVEASLTLALAEVIARGLDTASRFEGLGLVGAGDEHRARLDALSDGEPVTAAAWELGSALSSVGRSGEAGDIVRGRATHYTVTADGSYAAS